MKKIIFIVVFVALFPVSCFATKVGLISDEHVGSEKNVRNNMSLFLDKLNELKAQDPDIIISTGDATNNGEKSYYNQLKTIDGVVWVKGDNDKRYNLSSLNYTKDFDDVRVIVLDNSKGKLKKNQIKFLKQAENTDKDIIVAMHVPPLKRNVKPYLKKWKKFYDALTPNVKLVVSGHWHAHRETEYRGVKYVIVPPMFSGRYLIENL